MRIQLSREKIILLIAGIIIFSLIFQTLFTIKIFSLFKKVRNATRIKHLKVISDVVDFYFFQKGRFPECIPQPGRSIAINECSELKDYFTAFPQDPDPKHQYLIEYLNNEKNKIKIYSSAPEAKEIEMIK